MILSTFAALALTSCLKSNKQYVDFSNAGNIVNFPQSGAAFFAADALTADTSVVQFATDYATANANPALTVTLAVDQTLTDKYNAANTAVTYLPMPTSAYTLSSTTVTIAAGKQYAFTTLTVYKNTLDPTQSYMLPIKIASANGVAISANQSVHYFHVIGNDFAGNYLHDYTRIPASGNYVGNANGILQPDSPTQLEVNASGYYTGNIRYVVNFTKNGNGSSATYTNFTVALNSDDVTNIIVGGAGVTVANAPKFVGVDPAGPFTYDQVVHGVFKFNWTTSNGRDITDYFYKP